VLVFVLAVQALGDNWNTAFFRNHYIAGGLSIIYQFFAVLLLSTQQFYKTDRLAGVMLIPTCLWLVVASSLNLSIYRKNN
jgi:tryptophan-rich sensory protein